MINEQDITVVLSGGPGMGPEITSGDARVMTPCMIGSVLISNALEKL